MFRALVTKVGLDGHDRGVKIVARVLRDAGFEVVYGGLRQTPEMITATALEEDADVVGLSMHSGAHLTLAPAVVASLRGAGLNTPVVVGGIIPGRDIPKLLEMGVSEVLSPGSSAKVIVAAITRAICSTRSSESP